MNARPDTALLVNLNGSFYPTLPERKERPVRAERTPLLARFLFSPGMLFIVSLASWGLLRLALDFCAWLAVPGLALCLTLAIVSLGFASGTLAALDFRRPFSQQWRRLLAALSCWAGVGAGLLLLL